MTNLSHIGKITEGEMTLLPFICRHAKNRCELNWGVLFADLNDNDTGIAAVEAHVRSEGSVLKETALKEQNNKNSQIQQSLLINLIII